MSPKVFWDVVRAAAARAGIDKLAPHDLRRLVDVSAACGYHDQPHMIRERLALAGCTPRTWIATELPFLQDYELLGGDHGE